MLDRKDLVKGGKYLVYTAKGIQTIYFNILVNGFAHFLDNPELIPSRFKTGVYNHGTVYNLKNVYSAKLIEDEIHKKVKV